MGGVVASWAIKVTLHERSQGVAEDAGTAEVKTPEPIDVPTDDAIASLVEASLVQRLGLSVGAIGVTAERTDT